MKQLTLVIVIRETLNKEYGNRKLSCIWTFLQG